MKRFNLSLFVLLFLSLALAGCDFLDPARPTIQADTEIFGNYLEFEELPDQPGTFVLQLRVAPPRALLEAEVSEGRLKPPKEEGLSAEILVDSDTVVLLGGMPAALKDFAPGAEVVGIPVPGTTRMVGESSILIKADMLMDFDTFRRWRLPLMKGEDEPTVEDPAFVNSAGMEHGAVPLNGGRVLFFSARLRRAGGEGDGWVGARRKGLEVQDDSVFAPERTYRTEYSEQGWTAPSLVFFPSHEPARRITVSWVDQEETECLVTVQGLEDEKPWVGRSLRSGSDESWGEILPLEGLGEGDAFDAVYLTGSRSKVLFVTTRQGANQSDLFLFTPPEQQVAMPLEPRINTVGSEWGPRTGPENILYFSRGDRQLTFFGGVVHPVYLESPHRILFSEMAPTLDGKWVFFTFTRLVAVEPDLDIWVAALREDGSIGAPMALSDWQPEAG